MSQYLKEDTSFSDLMNLANKFSSEINSKKSTNYLNKSSIAKASKELIMSFPVLCSDTVDSSTAAMICKAVERNSITMLQLLLASANLQGVNGVDVIKKFHTNIDNTMNMDDYLDYVGGTSDFAKSQGWIKEGYAEYQKYYKQEYLGSVNLKFPEESLSEHSINDYNTTNRSGKLDIFIMREAKDNTFKYKEVKDNESKNKVDDLLTKQLLDSDVKKANELVPSLIIIRYIPDMVGTANYNSKELTAQEFIAGVKARLIATPSEEIIARIVASDRDKIDMKNLIRATTKEISFTKDFVAGIQQAKIDAKNNSKLSTTNPIWRALQSRSSKSSIKRLFRQANTAAAITTLVITQAEVNYIKNTYNIDMNNPNVAREFMDTYNLICIVIADEQSEIASFLYDGEQSYQVLTFSSLERETGDGSYKKVINLISKINRG